MIAGTAVSCAKQGEESSSASEAPDSSSVQDSSQASDSSESVADSSQTDEEVDDTVDENTAEEFKSKIKEYLSTASGGDWDKYWELFDFENFLKVSGNEVTEEDYKTEEKEYFDELSEELSGSYSGDINILFIKKLTAYGDNILGASLIASGSDVDHMISMIGYKDEDRWSIQAVYEGNIDKAYYDYEPTIIEALQAAAAGDADKFYECCNVELYKEITKEAVKQSGNSTSEDEINDTAQYMFDVAFDELGVVLDEDTEIKVLQISGFSKTDPDDLLEGTPEDAEFYGRFVLLLENADGGFQEIEGRAFSYNGNKGVYLAPD